MNNKLLSDSCIVRIIFILGSLSLCAHAQTIITTDTGTCDPSANITVSIPKGTSQAVIDSSVPQWRALGFSLRQILPNKDIIICTAKANPNIIDTVEKEGLSQTASISSIAIDASVIQTSNIFTRLSTIRQQNISSGQYQSNKFHPMPGKSLNRFIPDGDRQRKNLGGGAGSDDNLLLDQRLNLFINGHGGFGQQKVTNRSNGLNFDNLGMSLGVDYRLTEQWVLGTAFGYTNSFANMNKGLGSLSFDNYSLSVFTGYSLLDSLYIDALARFGWNNYNGRRNFTSITNASVQETALSDYQGNDYSFSLGGGYNIVLDGLSIRPLIRYDYIHNDIDSFQEVGKQKTGLISVSGQHIDSMRSAIGAELSYVVNTSYVILVPLIRCEWQHEFMNDSRLLTAFELNSPTSTQQLATQSADRDFVNLGWGLSAAFPHGISGFFYYETMLANSLITSHTFNGGVRIEF